MPTPRLFALSALAAAALLAGCASSSHFRYTPPPAAPITPDAVPEPATWAMLIIVFGLVGRGGSRHEKCSGETAQNSAFRPLRSIGIAFGIAAAKRLKCALLCAFVGLCGVWTAR